MPTAPGCAVRFVTARGRLALMDETMPTTGNGAALDDFRWRDVRTDVDKLDKRLDNLDAKIGYGFDKLTSQIEANRLAQQAEVKALDAARRPDVKTWVLGLGGFVVLGYLIIDKEAAFVSLPVQTDVATLKVDAADAKHWREVASAQLTSIASQNADSIRNRGDLGEVTARLADGLSAANSKLASLEADSREKNTQLCATQRELSIVAAYQARLDGELWNATHDRPLPAMPALPVGLSCAPRS